MTKSIDVLIRPIRNKKYWETQYIPDDIRCGAHYINRLIRVLELTKFMTAKQIETFEEGYDDQGVVIVSALWREEGGQDQEEAFDKWWAHYYPLLQKEFNDDDGGDWMVGQVRDMFEFIFTHEIDAINIT